MGTAAEPVGMAVEPVDSAVETIDTGMDASSELIKGIVVIFVLLEGTWCTQLLTDSAVERLEGSTVGGVPILIAHIIGSKATAVAVRLLAGVAAAGPPAGASADGLPVVTFSVSGQALMYSWFAG